MKIFLLGLIAVFMPVVAFAQEVATTVSNDQFVMDLIQSIGGLKGAGAIAIAVVVVQLLIKLLKTPMGASLLKKVSPNVVWAVTSGLGILAIALGLITSGVSVGAAIMHGAVLMPLMNYAYGIYERFVEKK